MEFRVLSGQHLTGFYQENLGGGNALLSHYGAQYSGEQIKVTTTGNRAIIYKKKEKHPYIENKYTYSYFLLGEGQISEIKMANLYKRTSTDHNEWGHPALTDDDIAQLQLSTVMDWNLINEPTNWTNATFYKQNDNAYLAFKSGWQSLFCWNMDIGTTLSKEIPNPSYASPCFGLPSSLKGVTIPYPLTYTTLNALYQGYDIFFPSHECLDYSEPWYKSTLLWNPDGSVTEYGKQFVGYSTLSAYDVYNMVDGSPYTESGSKCYCGGVSGIQGDLFNPRSQQPRPRYEQSSSGVFAQGDRMGGTLRSDLIQNLCEEYMFVGIYVTENYVQGKKYVEDGTVPDDATKNDDVGPKTDEDKTKNEDGKDNTKKDEQKLHDPDHTALNSGSTTYYYMNATALNSFIKWFWNDTGNLESILNNYISNMYGDLKECISGVYHFPCPLSALCSSTGNKEIVIGRYKTGLTADFLQNPPKNKLLGSVNLNDDEWKVTNSFLDYDGYTTIAMYLPYLGVVDLPTKTVQKTKISVYYAVDVPSMQLKYTIKSNGLIVHEQVVQFGDDVPISLSSGLQNVTNTVSAVTGIASDVAVLGTMGGGKKAIASTLVHTVADAHTTTDGITVKGNSSGVMGKWGSLKCALIVTKPISKRPSNYGKIKGNLICDTYKLSALSGLTICENPRITFTTAKPTEKEIEEIYSYLEKGVII